MVKSIPEELSNEEKEQRWLEVVTSIKRAQAKLQANATSVSANITKVNCSSEKIYGPVEVLQAYKIVFYSIVGIYV